MSIHGGVEWREEFGIDAPSDPDFFSNPSDLTPDVPQAHVLRQAFKLLELDGVLCQEGAPLVYFKRVKNLQLDQTLDLHRRFWNHGGAPILVLISQDEIHIYSGMSRPEPMDLSQAQPPCLIKTLDRVGAHLREFLLSVESGEFFRQYSRSFDPNCRVDRDLLNNLRDARSLLREATADSAAFDTVDALLCRVVFTCYLFDREVINASYLRELGIEQHSHLRDVLAIRPFSEAKAALYKLFKKLGNDFNGDLFSDDLGAEASRVRVKHIEVLCDFFHGVQVRGGQGSFWPYDFGFIPIETISAIYEHFLKEENQREGAFYTPRFLAELTLDTALEEFESLLNRTYLDPACGSGIFLVGLFNRIAEEWTRANPRSRNDRRARELMLLLIGSLSGVDKDPTACRIAAFSLYLAYLDQLSPRDIQSLQRRGRALPHLVVNATHGNRSAQSQSGGVIQCADFFSDEARLSGNFDLVIGNPPWASIAAADTPAGRWCANHGKPLPDKQIATAFIWKAAEHVSTDGRICFVLPHGTLFNHSPKAITFQKSWASQHTIDRVLNLTDLRRFLFSESIHPAIVVRYRKGAPDTQSGYIEYWAPKANWTVTQAEIVTIYPADRIAIRLTDLFENLEGPDAPQIWKQAFWASSRDRRFLDRLSLYPRLGDHVRSPSETEKKKRWIRAEGFQPVGPRDDPDKAKTLTLPSRNFVDARNPAIDLFLLPEDCQELVSSEVYLRQKSNTNTEVFKAPHVLITKGFRRIAFADFDVSFRHAVRGIHGPAEDRKLLMFLAAYLRSSLARYFGFHTSSNWGFYRPELHVEEVLRLPMPFPEQLDDERRGWEIINQIAEIVEHAAREAAGHFLSRTYLVEQATAQIEPLIEEYFGVHPLEKLLIQDTLEVIVPSVQPTQAQMPVPTIRHSTSVQQDAYTRRVCDMLNQWARNQDQVVRGKVVSSDSLGIGVAVLEKISRSHMEKPMRAAEEDVLSLFDRIRAAIPRKQKSIDPVRGIMVFDQNKLYLAKPIGQMYWTQTAALNDADQVAGTLLMHTFSEMA